MLSIQTELPSLVQFTEVTAKKVVVFLQTEILQKAIGVAGQIIAKKSLLKLCSVL